MPDTSELQLFDYVLLEYISKFKSISREQIYKKFPKRNNEIDLRLSKLSKYDKTYTNHFSISIPNTNYIQEEYDEIIKENKTIQQISKNSYHIDSLGLITLNDFKERKKLENKKMWLGNIWIPIIVSFTTYILLNYITPWLINIVNEMLNQPIKK